MATKKIKDWFEIFGKKLKSYELLLFQEFLNKFRKAIKEKDKQHIQFIRACNKARHSDKTEFIKKIFGEISLEDIVIEEEINNDKQSLGNNFTRDLLMPARKMSIPLSVLDNHSVREYKLLEDMNSVDVQKKSSVSPEKEKKFWAMLDVLTVNPELGKIFFGYEMQKDKAYFLHVKRSAKKIFIVRVAFDSDGNKWGYRSRNFFDPVCWGKKGDIFLYLTTVAKA